jgi:DNA-binding beta-propeller fold protein YncE
MLISRKEGKDDVKGRWIGVSLLLLLLPALANAPLLAHESDRPGTLRTLAGNGAKGFSGDGGSALDATLYAPAGLALDLDGSIFFADEFNHRIRWIEAATGEIRTAVGTGDIGNWDGGFSGDDGAASYARLNHPQDAALDAAGNLYFSDAWNHCIRRVAPDGRITRIAGNGAKGFSGDGDARSESLAYPAGIALDTSGHLYIADSQNDRICRVDLETGRLTTVAGSGPTDPSEKKVYSGDDGPATAARLNDPRDVVVDGDGNLYIADFGNNRIRRVDARTGIITRVAGTGEYGYNGEAIPAVHSKLNGPRGLALDGAGNLFIADTGNDRIRKVDAQTGLITTVAGGGLIAGPAAEGGPAMAARLVVPVGVAIDRRGNLLFSQSNNRIKEVMGIAAPGLFANQAFPTNAPLPGDLNEDGRVGAGDAILALRAVAGTTILTPEQTRAADLDADGRVTLEDVTLILKRDAGL